MSTLWARVADKTAEEKSWVLLFMFPKVILYAGNCHKVTNPLSQARLVKERLRRWKGGEYQALWDEAVESTRVKPKRGRKKKHEKPEKSLEEKIC